MWESMPECVKQCYQWKNGFLYSGKSRLSNYYTRILTELKNPLSKNSYCKIQYVVGDDERVYERIIEKSSLGKANKELSIQYGLCEFKSTAKNEIFNIEKMQLQDLKEQGWYIDSIGWHKINENWLYCAGNILFKPETEEEIFVSSELENTFQIQHSDSLDINITLQAINQLIRFDSIPLNLCLLYSISGLLRTLFCSKDTPPRFLLNIFGSTGKYKTTLAKYFFDIYRRGDGTSFACADLTSSDAALWNKIHQFKDCVFILDDLSPGINSQETARKEKSANNFIRVGANNEERHIMIGNKLQGAVARCSLAITAEYIFNKESIINRTVLVNMDRYPLDNRILKFLSKNPLLIRDFTIVFLEWCSVNGEKICTLIQNEWNEYRDNTEETNKNEHTYNPRLNDSIEILTICSKILYHFLKGKKVDAKGILSIFRSDLSVVKEEESLTLEYLNSLKDKNDIAEKIVELINSKAIELNSSIYLPSAFIQKNHLYITPEYLLEKLSEVILNEKLTKNKISAYLKKRNILEKDDSKDSTVKKRGVRYYRINIEELEGEAGIKIIFD